MPLFGARKKPSATRRRRRQTNPWLRSVVKEESSKALIKDMQAGNPVIQAAIVQGMTGIEVKPESIKLQTPQEKFETAVTNEMLKDLGTDQDFLQDAKERMLEKLAYGDGKGGRGRYPWGPYGRRGRDGEEEEFGPYGPYGFRPGYDPGDPMSMVDQVEQLKERLGGKSGLDSVMQSPVISDLIKTILPLLIGRGAPVVATGPQMISVVVDGRRVEMTREGYEIFKRQEARLLSVGDGRGSDPGAPAPLAPGADATPRATIPPSTVTTTSSTAPVAAAKAAEKAEGPKPQPAPAQEPQGEPIVIESEELRQNVLTLVKQLIEDTASKTPLEFAQYLVGQANANDMNAIVAVNFLNTITYEQGIGYLERLKHYGDFLPYIQKIEAKEQYMRAFLEHVKELSDEK